MVKDERGLVHLTQDQKHLVVYELFVLFEVAAHMLLQLVTNLRTRADFTFFKEEKKRNKPVFAVVHQLTVTKPRQCDPGHRVLNFWIECKLRPARHNKASIHNKTWESGDLSVLPPSR